MARCACGSPAEGTVVTFYHGGGAMVVTPACADCGGRATGTIDSGYAERGGRVQFFFLGRFYTSPQFAPHWHDKQSVDSAPHKRHYADEYRAMDEVLRLGRRTYRDDYMAMSRRGRRITFKKGA